MSQGLFITFEGIDGSGKTTQANLLYQRLKEKGVPAVFTREPGGANVKISEKIRNVILNHTSVEMAWQTELLLFMASRSQHVNELIRPGMENGVTVICDRFADASVAYQGYGRGLDIAWIRQLNAFACNGVVPHKTFLLDISAAEFEQRKNKENRKYDRIESAGAQFQEKVRQGYLTLAEQEPNRFVCINGLGTQEEIHNRIFREVSLLLHR